MSSLSNDPDYATSVAAIANAAHWLETRVGLDPASARHAARHVTEILYPYVLNLAHVHMAEGLRAAGVDEVADAIEQVRHQYVTKLTQPEE